MRLKRLIPVILLTTLPFPPLADDFVGNSRPSCDPTIQTCLPEPEKPQCDVTVCFTTAEAQRQYEIKHDCVFPPSSPCGAFDANTQCCGRNPRTGEAAVIDKVFSTPGVLMPGFDSFTWTNLKMACPNPRQNDAPEDDAWKKCQIDRKNYRDDYYEIIEVRDNGTARPYCIDGCSTPPFMVQTLNETYHFIVPDRNNPSGYSEESSFLAACTEHDVCYQTCQKDQNECDDKLLGSMLTACTKIPADHFSGITSLPFSEIKVNTQLMCNRAAEAMHTGVKHKGHTAFNIRRQQYCQCC